MNTYLYQNHEVEKTGRVAYKQLNNTRKINYIEIRSLGILMWTKWILEKDLLIIEKF